MFPKPCRTLDYWFSGGIGCASLFVLFVAFTFGGNSFAFANINENSFRAVKHFSPSHIASLRAPALSDRKAILQVNGRKTLGVSAHDYIREGVSRGAIIVNLAAEATANQYLRLDDVVIGGDNAHIKSAADFKQSSKTCNLTLRHRNDGLSAVFIPHSRAIKAKI